MRNDRVAITLTFFLNISIVGIVQSRRWYMEESKIENSYGTVVIRKNYKRHQAHVCVCEFESISLDILLRMLALGHPLLLVCVCHAFLVDALLDASSYLRGDFVDLPFFGAHAVVGISPRHVCTHGLLSMIPPLHLYYYTMTQTSMAGLARVCFFFFTSWGFADEPT